MFITEKEIIDIDIELIEKYEKILTDTVNTKINLYKGLISGLIEPWELYDFFKATLEEHNIIIERLY